MLSVQNTIMSYNERDKSKAVPYGKWSRRMCVQSLPYLDSGVEVADWITFEISLVFMTQHRGDDNDDEGHHTDGCKHRSNDPKVVGRILHHGCMVGKIFSLHNNNFVIDYISSISVLIIFLLSVDHTVLSWLKE